MSCENLRRAAVSQARANGQHVVTQIENLKIGIHRMHHDFRRDAGRDDRVNIRRDVERDEARAGMDARFRSQHRRPQKSGRARNDPDSAALSLVHREWAAGQQASQGLRISHFAR